MEQLRLELLLQHRSVCGKQREEERTEKIPRENDPPEAQHQLERSDIVVLEKRDYRFERVLGE
jgi:hypothetical protein